MALKWLLYPNNVTGDLIKRDWQAFLGAPGGNRTNRYEEKSLNVID
jgi:hypothetical protein